MRNDVYRLGYRCGEILPKLFWMPSSIAINLPFSDYFIRSCVLVLMWVEPVRFLKIASIYFVFPDPRWCGKICQIWRFIRGEKHWKLWCHLDRGVMLSLVNLSHSLRWSYSSLAPHALQQLEESIHTTQYLACPVPNVSDTIEYSCDPAADVSCPAQSVSDTVS